jgi:hypothetical protein
MPTLTFRIKKRPDTSAMLVLVRQDGSSTSGSTGPPNELAVGETLELEFRTGR